MAVQFLLNLCIALLWMWFRDEGILRLSTLISGCLVGIVIVFLMYRYYVKKFYLQRVYAALKFVLIFNSVLFKSAYLLFTTILNPTLDLKTDFFRHEIVLKGEWEVPFVDLLLTLTSGSVVMEITPEGNVFYVHEMYIVKYKDNLLQSLAKFDKAIMEVT